MKNRMIILLTAGLMGLACTETKVEEEPLIRRVRYVEVKLNQLTADRILSGNLEAGSESRLSFQVGGQIRKLNVKEGQAVKKGAVVAELDPIDFRVNLRETEAKVVQSRAQSDKSQSDYERTRRLYETQNTSRQALDAARALRDADRAALSAASEVLNRLKRQLGYTRLRAPASGRINAISAEANEVVTAGQVIVVLQAGEALQAAVDVPESMIQFINLGDSAGVRIGAVNASVKGVIQEIGVPTSGLGVFPVKVKLMSDPASARPGMAAEVRITPKDNEAKAQEGYTIPLTAIGEDREGRFVYLVEGEPGGQGTVKRQSVKTGVISATGIQVLRGLSIGQRVVVAGVSRIQDGMTVLVPSIATER